MSVLIKNLSDRILNILISRPKALNAINAEVMDGLREIIHQTYQDNEIGGVIISGDGEKAFVAGADISELTSLTAADALRLSKKGQDVFKLIENSPKPVIAAVNGFALGGGCELAMACHMRLATVSSKFGQPEINLGIIPGYGGTQRLAQLIGRGKALELLLTGDMITAENAKSLGIVNEVYSDREEMLKAATTLMQKILTKSPIAIRQIIKSVNAGYNFENAGYEQEAKAFSECTETADFKEGTSAFLEKRKPVFKGV